LEEEKEETWISGGLLRQNHTALLHLNPDPNATCKIRCPVIKGIVVVGVMIIYVMTIEKIYFIGT